MEIIPKKGKQKSEKISQGSIFNKNGAQTAHVQMFSRDSVQMKFLKENLDLHGHAVKHRELDFCVYLEISCDCVNVVK